MRVTIWGKTQDISVTTVTLERNSIDPTQLSIMHCVNCGEKVIQYQGHIVQIIPGGLPQNILEMGVNLIAHCSRCKTKYLINAPI